MPYAIAAAVAYPDRPVYCIIGDGGLSMLMGELITIAAYKLNIKIIVIKNDTLGQIKWEQMVFLGNPEYGCDLFPADFTAIARGCGIGALRIEEAATCAALLDQAIATEGPVLDRSGGRSVHAAHAGQDQGQPGSQVRGVAAARRAQPRQDRTHGLQRHGAGIGLDRRETQVSSVAADETWGIRS